MMRTQRHELLDILVISLCAVIGGVDHWTEVVEFGQAKQSCFAGLLKLTHGIPSHDTFARVFRLINTEVLEKVCHEWLRSIAEMTAIPELLKLLDIQGCIVTIDAMGCQKAIAKDIMEAGAHYVLGLKANHRHQSLSVASWFDKNLPNGFAKQAQVPKMPVSPCADGLGHCSFDATIQECNFPTNSSLAGATRVRAGPRDATGLSRSSRACPCLA